MVEIKRSIKIIILILSITIFPKQITLADIYQSNCKTVKKDNSMKSFSMVFSFYRKSIVINKYNGQKTKYKINISQVNDADEFIFDAKDEFYTLIFNPMSSYVIKNQSNSNNSFPKKVLIDDGLDEVKIDCTTPKIIKKENDPNSPTEAKLDEKNIQNILEKLKANGDVENNDLNKIMQNLNASNKDTKINPEQLQQLLKSQNMIGKLTSKDTLQKLKSEEFLTMIKEEFQKMFNK